MARRGSSRASRVEDIDRGWAKAMRDFNRLGGNKKVAVGILSRVGGKSIGHNSGLTRAGLLAIHEFGATVHQHGETIEIPERAPIRKTYDGNLTRYTTLLENGVARVLNGGATIDGILDELGAAMALDVRNAIRGRKLPPPNSEKTIRRKGSTIPLIDTGELITSIGHEVVYGRLQGRYRSRDPAHNDSFRRG